ncbi:GNAT family N-acetyltransferase [Pseudoroseicyclus tamaricis]|uniref:GNAT family N-acetyltransferase n=1 Tax=Pseudoroseicyclus tamaricis TaxID=2705421 RepID=A0A6B2JW46_9RHOB|nr:GNAT family N-acetyltransferase [Pseudoroseicyclus tamaricis]NDV02717.1 GNAT family N-acetyltransferase [Pseudoroseicyclus tamaricis]
MSLTRRPVVRADLRALMALKVAPAQRQLVAETAVTLAQQAYEPPGTHVWGLWDGDTAVGLLAMVDPRTYPELEPEDDREAAFVWRLMIAEEHQGKGYGRAALGEVFSVARDWGLPRVALTFTDIPGNAEPFYLAHGFTRTGRVVDGEVEMMRGI